LILNYICNLNLSNIEEAKKPENLNREYTIGGIVTAYKQGNTKTGNPYGVITMEDFTGSAEIPLFGKDFIEYSKYGHQNMYLLIKGKFQARQYKESIIDFRISGIQPMSEVKDSAITKITIRMPLHELEDTIIAGLSLLIKNNPGNCLLYFKIEDIEKHLSISLCAEMQKFALNKEIIRFLQESKTEFTIN
jgi:DNA polymerase-3 subunit alpha